MNTLDFLSIATAIVPERACTVFEGKKFTYADVDRRSTRLANALRKMGIKKGDRVGILEVNCPQYLETYFAAVKAGAILVPMNYRAKEEELTYLLNHSEARVLFIGERYLDLVNSIRPRLTSLENYVALGGKRAGMLPYEEVVASGSDEPLSPEIADEDVTILMYTAGTTGRPKGVPMTHGSYGVYVLDNVEPANPDVGETNILTVPLYHVAGFQSLLSAIYGGRTMAMMRQFETKDWLETVQRDKATRAMLVPTMLKWIVDFPEFAKYDLSSLKVITYGAAPMPFEVIKKAIELLPWVRFINAFGQTETASTITTLGPEDHVITGTPAEKEKKLKRLTGSIGKPLPDIQMKVIDEEGKEVPVGEIGEIVTRGPRIMSGYWKDPEKTKQAMTADGWLRTGDKGYRDEDGYFFLAGRGDDMIKRAGEYISPEELEQILHTHPKVEECAVIGVPDAEWGQLPKAIVVLKKGETCSEAEMMEFCRQKLASFKRPRAVVFVDSLPRNPMGKVLKRVLRETHGKS